jgi:hypothetical protein
MIMIDDQDQLIDDQGDREEQGRMYHTPNFFQGKQVAALFMMRSTIFIQANVASYKYSFNT